MKQILDAITFIVFMVFICFLWVRENPTRGTAKSESLSCVRVAQMPHAEPIKYICEVRK